jgi:hypothetical protein
LLAWDFALATGDLWAVTLSLAQVIADVKRERTVDWPLSVPVLLWYPRVRLHKSPYITKSHSSSSANKATTIAMTKVAESIINHLLTDLLTNSKVRINTEQYS